jgi:two-component system sensor histidine kinase KdpD
METQELVRDLEQVPRRTFEYRGVAIDEMDIDAILARKPAVVLVDELAHTNVPGSRNRKRYQDVMDILEAGLNVIGAFNVQHLESLNDMITRVTGVTVHETVPDAFLKQADQVVTLDLAVEDLVDRLRSGKIYAPEKIPWALEHFFKSENLMALRELALREVAESVDRLASPRGNPEPKVSSERVMVCLSSHPPRAAALLRRGSRLAGRLSTDWFVVYVQTAAESPERINSEAQRHLLANINLAHELGAEVVRLEGDAVVETLLNFAKTHDIKHIILGRSQESRWRQWLGVSTMHRLIQRAAGFDLHLVSFDEAVAR